MKILCFIDSLGSGGAQRQLVELAKGFKEVGHEVSFLVYHEFNFFKKELDIANITVNFLIEGNPILRILKIRRFIRDACVDTVLSFLDTPNLIAILSGFPYRNWKLVVGERSANPLIKKDIKKIIQKRLYYFSDQIVSNSKANIEIIKSVYPGIKNEKCHVVYNIVDTRIWVNGVKNDREEDSKFNLAVAASHISYKNCTGLINALALLSNTEKEKLRINWYGKNGLDGSYETAVKLVLKLNLNKCIQFYPETKNIKEVYKAADAIGLFSFHEGLPNTVCEGMSMSKLVLSSNVSDISVFLSEQQTGIFDPNDIPAMAKSLSWALSLTNSDLLQIGIKNRSIAEEFFNRDVIVESYLSLFNSK